MSKELGPIGNLSVETEGADLGLVTAPIFKEEFTCIAAVRRETGEPLSSAIVREMIGSSKSRSTPQPALEAQAMMRQLVDRCIAEDRPIPVLVPMGPKKPIPGEGVDVAEVGALRTLAALNKRLESQYPRGAHFFFREEDVTGWHLEAEVPGIRECIEHYLAGFEGLIRVLGYDKFMSPVRESTLTDLAAYQEYSARIEPLLDRYIQDTDHREGLDDFETLPSYRELQAAGWQGPIPAEQRRFYRDRYSFLYPNRDSQQIDAMMVRYLATTLARYRVQAAYPPEIADGHFQLNFAPPVPGIPPSLVTTRVYYRTLPEPIHKTTTPFWRAKGVLAPDKNGSYKPVFTSWHKQDSRVINSSVVLNNGLEQVIVQAGILA